MEIWRILVGVILVVCGAFHILHGFTSGDPMTVADNTVDGEIFSIKCDNTSHDISIKDNTFEYKEDDGTEQHISIEGKIFEHGFDKEGE